ncbi:predicted protein [Arabidopsis lyrata subsp. lyrata]|uniref:Predicted protein n=1 Tax=Arabidopsis lyrata subsp. lyrata TaxID=81972 RepID=D7MLZ2_ARALL|nr:predicted protein [Arabidopsis lyrata subsp. lyrata]
MFQDEMRKAKYMRQRQTQVRLFVWSPQPPAATKRTTTCGNVAAAAAAAACGDETNRLNS